jgi:hypothetical protein
MRRKGLQQNDIHVKLLKLQDENEKLKKTHISLNEVENLIAENRHMKTEIQKIYQTGSINTQEIKEPSLKSEPLDDY